MSAKWEKTGTNEGTLTFEIAEEKIQEGLTVAFNKVKKNTRPQGSGKEKITRKSLKKLSEKKA